MKKHLFAIVFLFSFSINLFAQVGIGTNTPNASAQLELSSDTKGFLPTRIALTAANTAAPVTAPAAGLLIYNTATAGTNPNNVTPGYYYWSGTAWVRLATGTGGGGLQPGTAAGQMQYWNGSQWVLLSAGTYGSALVVCNGVPTWGGCLPIVGSTKPATSVTGIFAVTGGEIINDGGIETESGICYGTSPNPTILNNIVYGSKGDTGAFTSYLTGLTPNTTYYARMYATNKVGTVYGNQVTFTTTASAAPVISSFTPASAAAGETVTITGLNLSGVSSVKFGGVEAYSFYVNYPPTSITAQVAAGASGAVSVTTPYGTTSKTGFIFIDPSNTGSNSVAPENLIAYWPFDLDSRETKSSQTAYDGIGASYSSFGKIGNCLTLTDGYLLYNPISNISQDTALQSYTISMWVNVPASAAPGQPQDPLRSLFQVTGNKYSDIWGQVDLELSNWGARNDTIYVGARQHQQDGYQPYDHEGLAVVKYANSTNKWIFLTATYNGIGTNQTMRIYANGELINVTEFTNVNKTPASTQSTFRVVPTGNYPADGVFPTNKVYIGTLAFRDRGNDAGDGYTNYAPYVSERSWAAGRMTGKIDDIRLFNKALSAAEVLSLYNFGLQGQ
ncbi:MAG: IPT/TIG domain-containing protein [Ferruginibacter sp.]